MKLAATLLALTLPLMAAKCDDARAILVKTCNTLADTYAHYDAVAASGALSARTQARVAAVRAQTDDICTSPETATTISITAAAARAYVALNAAFREGGTLRDAKVGYTQVQNLKVFLEEARRK